MEVSDDAKIKFLYEHIAKETDSEKLALLGEELRSLLEEERARKRPQA